MKSQLVSSEENQRLFSNIYVNFSNSILSLIVVNTYVIGVSGYKFKFCHPDNFMKKAKIYIPTKTAMQSGRGKLKKWVLEFETKDPSINPLMGWEMSTDTLEEVTLKFPSKEKAIEYAEANNISYKVTEPKKKEYVIKSYADNFLKN